MYRSNRSWLLGSVRLNEVDVYRHLGVSISVSGSGLFHTSCSISWPPRDPSVTCFTDAARTWGCGGILGEHPFHWFQLAWPAHCSSSNIAAKELVPVVIAAALWGSHWAGHRVLFQSDNQSVVAAVNSGSSRDHTLAHLVWCLFFFSASWHFTLLAIPGVQNYAANALSGIGPLPCLC